MPRTRPHRLAFFSLVPINDRAWEILSHPENDHLVSGFMDNGGDREMLYGLDIGLHIGSKSRYTLATIGRNGDIVVEGPAISRIQCSFEIHEDNKEIMLQDRSTNRSTQFFGDAAMPFEEGRGHRRVVIDENVNLEFGFGGVACDMYQFRIFWHDYEELTADIDDREDNPPQTRTILDEQPASTPSRPMTRIHTPKALERIRYSMRQILGAGSFGEVWKVVNVDSGNYLAVKRAKRPTLMSRDYAILKREVETLSQISHRNIVEYRAAQWEDEYFDIIMELKPGNVQDLILDDLFLREPKLANPFLHQMLQALDYLSSKDIIHRDIKPENILYTPKDEDYVYQLADFGLANLVADAQSFAGTRIYMAPELDDNSQPQTPKMDVWSLFVTLAYAMDAAGFRRKQLDTTPLRIQAIREAANEKIFKPLQAMAIVDPSQRAAAGDILDQLFNGEGRTTASTAKSGDEMRPWQLRQSSEADIVGSEERRFREAVAIAEGGVFTIGRRPGLANRRSASSSASPKSLARGIRRTEQNTSRLRGVTPHQSSQRRSARWLEKRVEKRNIG